MHTPGKTLCRVLSPLFLAPLLLLAPSCGGGSNPAPAPPPIPAKDFTPNLPKFAMQPLLDDLAYLASPALAGRRVGSPGNAAARAYLENRFQALGLSDFGAGYAQAFSHVPSQASGTNVVGYLTGSESPNSAILISAHFDHIGSRNGLVCPGADDNASGTAAVLQLAAYFKTHPPTHTLIFALFDGEEQGLWGSEAFASQPPIPLSQIELVFNLDMIAQGTGGRIFVGGTSLGSYPEATNTFLRNTVIQGFSASKVEVRPDFETYDAYSDQQPFRARGVPFLFFSVGDDDPNYHTPADTYESIPKVFYWAAVEAILDTLLRLDATPSLPTLIPRPEARELEPFSVKWNPHPWKLAVVPLQGN